MEGKLINYCHGVSQLTMALECSRVDLDGQRDGLLGWLCVTLMVLFGLASLVSGSHACVILVLHMVILRDRGYSSIPPTSACISSANSH